MDVICAYCSYTGMMNRRLVMSVVMTETKVRKSCSAFREDFEIEFVVTNCFPTISSILAGTSFPEPNVAVGKLYNWSEWYIDDNGELKEHEQAQRIFIKDFKVKIRPDGKIRMALPNSSGTSILFDTIE